jgi:aminoglycoside 2''-phosphotransferase
MTTPDWRQVERDNNGLSVRSASFLGEGWCSTAYLVNGELVFRFPKRLDHWPELNREIGFLAWAADRLPLPVPRYLGVARESPAGPSGYAMYGYLPGRRMNIDSLSSANQTAAAERIALFLRELHGLRPPHDVALQLPREDARLVAEDCLARTEREILPDLDAFEIRTLHRRFGAYLDTADNFSFEAVVLHADLSSDHLLIDNGTVGGVLDFGDVNWGDRDYDFHYLFLDFGEAFAMEVARLYEHPNLDQLRSKVRYFALADQIGTILEGPGRPLDGQVEAAWARVRQFLREENGGW